MKESSMPAPQESTTTEGSRNALASQVLRAIAEKDWKLASAESLTGGRLADAFVNIPGASEVFLGGVITYTDAMKTRILGVDSHVLASRTAYSREVACEMARGVARLYGAQVGVSSTGVAGPGPDMGFRPGTGFVAVSTPAQSRALELSIENQGRSQVRDVFVDAALKLLLECLRPLAHGQ